MGIGFEQFNRWYSWQYYATHPWCIFEETYLKIKWFLQRGWRGYADCDAWGIDTYLTYWMPDALRHLKKNKHGIPMSVIPDAYMNDGSAWDTPENKAMFEKAEKDWDEALDKMILGFEAHAKMESLDVMPNTPEWAALEKQHKEGMEMFVKHYGGLWD